MATGNIYADLGFFSPICCLLGCHHWRKKQLSDLVTETNNDILIPKGLYLKWNDDYHAIQRNHLIIYN